MESSFAYCHCVFKEMRKASHAFQDYMNPIFDEVGLKPLEGCLLAELDREDGQTMSELAANTSIVQSNLPPLWHALEGKGLIERRKDDSDARSFRLYLTREGADMIEHLNALVSEKMDATDLTENGEAVLDGLELVCRLFSVKPHQGS